MQRWCRVGFGGGWDFAKIPVLVRATVLRFEIPPAKGPEPMPQIQLPIFPQGVTYITALLAFSKQDGRVTYFNGSMPVVQRQLLWPVSDNYIGRLVNWLSAVSS